MTGEQVPAHGADTALCDALLDVLVKATARQLAQLVGANALLGLAPHRDHVRLAEALARVLVQRARHLAADRWDHLAVRIEEPGEDGARVAVEQRIVDVEDGGGALERLHAVFAEGTPFHGVPRCQASSSASTLAPPFFFAFSASSAAISSAGRGSRL